MIGVWLLRAGWVLLAPVLALVTRLHPRTREHWSERWALRTPPVAPGAVWVHASSVGEGQGAAALCEALRALPARPVLLRTASTDSGLATARGHHVCCARPVDAPWVVGRWLDRVRPRLLVLVEGDLWPNLMLGCRARGIPVVVAGLGGGRGSTRLRRRAPGLFAEMADAVALWLVKEDGLALPGAVASVGELKGLPVDLDPVPLDRPTLVAGSTRSGDDAAVLAAWRGLEPRPLLVLAPRHPARFDAVAEQVSALGVPWQRWSAGPVLDPGTAVVLVDTLGDLSRFYPQATAAFVGGTLSAEIGGHSPAEAMAAGLAVVSGPHHHANAPAWDGADASVAVDAQDLTRAMTQALARGRGASVTSTGVADVTGHLARWLHGPLPAERALRPWLAPFGVGFRVGVALRALGGRLRPPVRVPVPVISVGGLGSGGAGKTPMVTEVVRRLQQRGRHPAVVARGYGRRGGREVRGPAQGSGAADLGDELAVLAARGVPVVSAPDRVAGARQAVAHGADVVVLDDGFQHRRLHRDLDLVVVDPRWPTEGGPLPVGEAREALGALARADLLCLSGPGELPGAPEGLARVRTEVVPVGWRHGETSLPLDALPPGPVTAIAGIARPGRFLAQLVALGLDVRRWRVWPDHHPWTPAEEAALCAAAEGSTLVCTEKDRVRLSPTCDALALRVGLQVTSGEAALDRLLDQVLA